MRYRCLVLDHDDTVVNSTAQIHYPSFMKVLSKLRPEVCWTLEEYLRYNFDPGFLPMVRELLHFTDEELADEAETWAADVAAEVPAVFPGMREVIRQFQENGGKICVVSHSYSETIRRDYRENGLPEPDRIFGWELPKEQVKPSAYPLRAIMENYGFCPAELVVVDDLRPGLEMARSCGVEFLAAGWAYEVPEIAQAFAKSGVPYLRTVQALADRLF